MTKKEKQKDEQNIQEKNNETTNEEVISRKEFDDLKDTLQRTHAEFQNFRKRSEDERSRFIKLSNEELIKNLIPVLDNFELALKHNKEEGEFSQGMNLIYEQLYDVLHREGLQRIQSSGKFDPNVHEAVMVEESDKESGLILQELQKGYKLGDKIIRSPKVKISKQKNNVEVDKNE
ncbi:nucleotide exchange factor GrpE [Candidatus Woesearchaeota archaeon]|nr:nucleotide exchange factor GrpE [Candidatus Woesearchaeota archaeon]